ncbi:MAG: hypothetical protein SWK76_01935 [Actinomycetota bacterium]|nr:hypothetical protein [Actinomycetota bacterium]
MSAKRGLLLVFGGGFILGSLLALLAGSAVTWASQYHKDAEGFHITDPIDVRSGAYAVISGIIDIDRGASIALDWLGMDKAKVEAESKDPSQPIFLGIAETGDIRYYLRDVEHDEVTNVDIFPSTIEYETRRGEAAPELPVEQDFWLETSSGVGKQVIEFELKEREYTVLVMKSDGSAGVDIELVFGIKSSGAVLAIGIILLAVGMGLMAGGIIMVVFGARSPREQPQRIPPPPPA